MSTPHNQCELIYGDNILRSINALRYVLMIEETYAWVEMSPIFYDAGSLIDVGLITGDSKRYAPELIIRHKQSRQAFLIDIRPEGYDNYHYLAMVQKVAKKYIQRCHLDWSLKIIVEDGIILSRTQHQKLQAVLDANRHWAGYHDETISQPGIKTSRQNSDFVIRGVLPAAAT